MKAEKMGKVEADPGVVVYARKRLLAFFSQNTAQGIGSVGVRCLLVTSLEGEYRDVTAALVQDASVGSDAAVGMVLNKHRA